MVSVGSFIYDCGTLNKSVSPLNYFFNLCIEDMRLKLACWAASTQAFTLKTLASIIDYNCNNVLKYPQLGVVSHSNNY